MGQFEAFVGVNFWTALFILLNTLTIYFVAKKYLFKPVMKIIQERQQQIDDMYAEASCAKEQAILLQGEYEQRLSSAAQTGERMVKEAVARGQSREEEIVSRAKAEAAAILDKAAADVAQEKKKAVNDAKDEISVIALAIAGKVIGRTLNEADQVNLVDHFIDGLGEEE